jgi:DNA repair protein RadD
MTLKFTPRPYQIAGHEQLRENFRKGMRRQVLVMPTGAGKTGLAAMIIESAIAKGNEVLFLAHRKELIEQCSKTLRFFGVYHGVIKHGHYLDRPDAPVQVASVQTLIRRQHRPKARVVILDEAHRSLNETNKTILSWYPDALSLGLTGTPERRDGRGLDEMYEGLVEPIKMTQAVEQGYLLPCRIFDPGSLDLRGISKVGGDYSLGQLADRAKQNPRRVGNLVENWMKWGENQQTVVFAINKDDSRAIVARYIEAGVVAEHLDGDMADGTREQILARFEAGETRVISNCDVLVEGYDLPSIGCIQLARPTLSVTRFLQMIGRGSRPHGNMKYFIVLDQAGCCDRLGDPIQDWPWSLQGRKSRQSATDLAEIKLVTCEVCSRMRPANIFACPQCHPAPTSVQVAMFGALPVEVEGILVERGANRPTNPDDARRCRKCGSAQLESSRHSDLKIRWRCRSCKATEFALDEDAARKATEERRFSEYFALERARRSKGRKPSWSAHVYRSIFGTWPPREWLAKIDGMLKSSEAKS